MTLKEFQDKTIKKLPEEVVDQDEDLPEVLRNIPQHEEAVQVVQQPQDRLVQEMYNDLVAIERGEDWQRVTAMDNRAEALRRFYQSPLAPPAVGQQEAGPLLPRRRRVPEEPGPSPPSRPRPGEEEVSSPNSCSCTVL